MRFVYGNEEGLKQPCQKDCPDRCAGCSAVCEKWRTYVEQRNAAYKTRYENAEAQRYGHAKSKATNGVAAKKKNRRGYF